MFCVACVVHSGQHIKREGQCHGQQLNIENGVQGSRAISFFSFFISLLELFFLCLSHISAVLLSGMSRISSLFAHLLCYVLAALAKCVCVCFSHFAFLFVPFFSGLPWQSRELRGSTLWRFGNARQHVGHGCSRGQSTNRTKGMHCSFALSCCFASNIILRRESSFSRRVVTYGSENTHDS